tara:strand:+ start:619 stop:927 length:309 start_codon:yes stop_codon:yes gene_type:complete
MTTTSFALQTVTIQTQIPSDSEIEQLKDIGTQITKYIYNKVQAHPLSETRKPILYKDIFKNQKLVVILPETNNDSNIIIDLRNNIRNIVTHGQRHEINIEIQ